MDRPQMGTNPIIDRKDDESYLDFVTSMTAYLPRIQPTVVEKTNEVLEAFRSETGREPQNVHEAHAVLGDVPILQTRHRLRRDVQEMKHRGIAANFDARRDELLAELDRYDRMGPGSVEYDPSFVVPDYARRDIHLLPGGYVEDPLAGYKYHYGTRIFFAGGNDEDQIHRSSVDKLPVPADGQVRRILDIGCSSGQSATALKQRFPQAEVWGIDAGVPMVRYAHKRAVDMGLDVHFAQRMAEDTRFPDAYFDLAHSFIVFHELPLWAGEAVVREMARVLRPGGLFLVTDFQTAGVPRGDGRGRGVLGEIYGDIDARHNCEPYAWDFTHSDFESMLRRYFSTVEVRTEGYGMPLRVCTR